MRIRSLLVAASVAAAGTVVLAAPAAASTLTVTTTADTVDVAVGDGRCADATGACSLRAALQEATAGSGPDLVELAPGARYTLTRAGAGEDGGLTGDLDVSSAVHLLGRGAVLDAGRLDRAVDVHAGRLEVSELTVVGGAAPAGEGGGGVRSRAELVTTDTSFEQNAVTGSRAGGGAILNDGGVLTMTGGTLFFNTADATGGGLQAVGGTTTLRRVVLDFNFAGQGAGVHLFGAGSLTMIDGTFQSNSANAQGGGVWISRRAALTVRGTGFFFNNAGSGREGHGGGAIYTDGGSVSVLGSRLWDNSASREFATGGGILNRGGRLLVSDSVLLGNVGYRAGGAIAAEGGSTTLRRATLDVNSADYEAPGDGGGVHVSGAGALRIEDSRLSNNAAATSGGGVWASSTGPVEILRTEFLENRASGASPEDGGGALYHDGGVVRISSSEFRVNQALGAAGSGGGILSRGGELTLDAVYLAENEAERAGGGVEVDGGRATAYDSSFVRNTVGAAPGNGGGLHTTGAASVVISGGRVAANTATAEGGGLWNSANGTLTVTGTPIYRNSALIGPEVFNDGGTFTINGVPVPPGP